MPEQNNENIGPEVRYKKGKCGHIPDGRKDFALVVEDKASSRNFDEQTKTGLEMAERGLIPIGHNRAYGLKCEFCNACMPLRINTEKVALSRNKRKQLKRGDIKLSHHGIEHYADTFRRTADINALYGQWFYLYRDFMNTRIENSHIYDPTVFNAHTSRKSHYVQFTNKETGKLQALGLVNMAGTQLSFDRLYYRSLTGLSVGTYSILKVAEMAKTMGVKSIYLATWVKDDPVLSYKSSLPGLETFQNGQWIDFDPKIHTQGPNYTQIINEYLTEKGQKNGIDWDNLQPF